MQMDMQKSRYPSGVYLSFPLCFNDTQEEAILTMAASWDLGGIMVNPNNLQLRAHLEQWKNDQCITDDESNDVFFRDIAMNCDRCVFTTFPKYWVASGVPSGNTPRIDANTALVIDRFIKRKLPVYWVSPEVRSPGEVNFVRYMHGISDNRFQRLTVEQTDSLMQEIRTGP